MGKDKTKNNWEEHVWSSRRNICFWESRGRVSGWWSAEWMLVEERGWGSSIGASWSVCNAFWGLSEGEVCREDTGVSGEVWSLKERNWDWPQARTMLRSPEGSADTEELSFPLAPLAELWHLLGLYLRCIEGKMTSHSSEGLRKFVCWQ